jgi:hypothetical protein
MTNLLNKTILEIKKDTRTYHLHCDQDSPLGEVYDVVNQLRSYIVDRMLSEQKASEPQPPTGADAPPSE